MSNSSEGKILLNILKSLPKRGIWMIRQEGAWGVGDRERENLCGHQQSRTDTSAKPGAHRSRNLRPKACQNRVYAMYLISNPLQELDKGKQK